MGTEPIVFWGPGSEWFWTMLQTVVVAITLVGIYYQFRLQRAANAFEQLSRIAERWESEEMFRARLDVARAFVAGDEMPHGALNLIGDHWESVASLVRQRHVDEHLVSDTLGGAAAVWWTAFADELGRIRRERMDPTLLANFEWLAKRASADGVKAGSTPGYDREALRSIFEAGIPSLADRIRMAEASRLPPDRPASRPRRSEGSG